MRAELKATPEECERALPGDDLVSSPDLVINNGISIQAPPAAVWPWLAQMGSGRGGWYAYDFVDDDGRPSATTIVPGLQDIQVGDVLPALPGADDAFVVAGLEVGRDLVLTVPRPDGTAGVSWEFHLDEQPPDRTRLVVRGRVAKDWPGGLQSDGGPKPRRPIEYVYALLARTPRSIMLPLAVLGHDTMQARQLRGIKRRAEAARRTDAVPTSPRPAPPWSPWRSRENGGRTVWRKDSPRAVVAIKAIHTLAWFSIESCMVYVLYAGFKGRTDRTVALAAGVVAGESLVFAGNGFRCPLTELAESYGADRGGVTDIYLPKWFAHNIPAIHVPLIGLAIGLHARNWRRRARTS